MSAARIAVTGRQRWYAYLASYSAITPSAIVVSSNANIRAFWARLLWNVWPAISAIWFHTFWTGAAPQKRPMSVRSGLRRRAVQPLRAT